VGQGMEVASAATMSPEHADSIRGNDSLPSLEWSRVKDLRAVVPQHVVYRALASETVLLNVRTGTYLGMDEVGSRCFEAMRESPDLQTALETLLEEYDAPSDRIRHDLVGYCAELLSQGLIELEDPGD